MYIYYISLIPSPYFCYLMGYGQNQKLLKWRASSSDLKQVYCIKSEFKWLEFCCCHNFLKINQYVLALVLPRHLGKLAKKCKGFY